MLVTLPPVRKWLFMNLLAIGDKGAIIGSGGLSKSFLALVIALSLAVGRTLIEYFEPTGSHRILFYGAEDPPDIFHTRIHAIDEIYKFTDEERKIIATNFTLYANVSEPLTITRNGVSERTQRFSAMRSDIEHINPDLIILDTKARWDGGEENDAAAATAFVCALSELAGDNCAILCLHHVNKKSDSPDPTRGSSAFKDGLRWCAHLQYLGERELLDFGVAKNDAKKFIKFDVIKSNYAPIPPTRYLVPRKS